MPDGSGALERPAASGRHITAALGDRKLVTITGEDGRYTFEGMTAGVWQVSVELFGFTTARKNIEIGSTPVNTDWSLELRPSMAQRRQAGRGNNTVQVLQAQAESELTAARPSPGTETASADTGSTEAFLVNGSLSRGLQQGEPDPAAGQGMDPFRQGRAGLPGEPGQGGSPGMGPGGGGGFGGGGRGGFGGGGMGGGRGGFGGQRPGGPQGQRRPGGPGREGVVFGNRANRGNQGIRGMVSFTFRDSAFDAAPYSLNGQPSDKPAYSQYRWGLSVGGPLVLGKLVKSPETFFFINYFGTRAENPFRGVATVPTLAERSGDFSDLGSVLFDPRTRQPFAGNRLDSIDPVAAGLLAYIPVPNQPGTLQNFVFVTSVPQNTENVNIRVNRSITKKDRLGVTLNLQRRDGNSPQIYGFIDSTEGSGLNTDVSWTRAFSAHLINTAHVTFNRNRNETLPFFAYGTDVAGQLGIAGTSRDPINYGPPNVSFTNYGTLSDASPVLTRNQAIGVSEALAFTRGTHNLSFGGEFRRNQLNTTTDQNARGTFGFSGLLTSGFDGKGQPFPNTGYDFADFLLGFPQTSSVRFGSTSTYFRSSMYAAFAQDDWRPRSNLSFTLGARYEYFSPYREKHGQIANLDVAPGFTGVAVVTPSISGPYSGAFPSYLINPDRNNFSPRVALAWKPREKDSLQFRAGYGIYYNEGVYSQIASRMAAQPPFAQTSSVNTSITAPLTIETGLVTIPAGKDVLNTYAVDRSYRVPYAQTWTTTLQRTLPGAIVLEVGYLGTKGTRLDIQRLPNRAAPGSPLTAEERRQIGNAVGFTFESSEGNSIYHALQVRVTRRFRRGLSGNALYTFGKSIDNSSTFGGAGNTVAQDDRNLAAERGLSSFDRRHTLNLGYMLSSPVGVRNGLMEGHPWALKLLRDWTLSGAITIQSGTPFTARVLGNRTDPTGSGAVGAGRADATGSAGFRRRLVLQSSGVHYPALDALRGCRPEHHSRSRIDDCKRLLRQVFFPHRATPARVPLGSQ